MGNGLVDLRSARDWQQWGWETLEGVKEGMGCGVSPHGSAQKLLLGEAAAVVGLKRLRREFLEPLVPTRLWQQGQDREGTGRVWHPLLSKQSSVRILQDQRLVLCLLHNF